MENEKSKKEFRQKLGRIEVGNFSLEEQWRGNGEKA